MGFEDISIAGAADLPNLAEQHLLPAIAMENLQGFRPFPRQSPGLQELGLFRQSLPIPRFSLFHGSDIGVNGFRLFESEGKLFTDESLVIEDPEFPTWFANKLHAGATENIDPAYLAARDPHEITIDEPVLVLAADEPSNFGSWVYRFLPKLLLALAHAPDIAIFSYRQPWIDNILALVCPDRRVILHNPVLRYRLRRAVIPTLPAPHVLLRPEIVAAFAELAGGVPESPAQADRIYVSRRRQSLARPGHRIFESETKLAEILMAEGYREFFPEDHPIEGQIAVFAHARTVVACGGANLFGAVYARRADLVVDIESTTDWAFAHSNLLSSIPAAYSMVRGEKTGRGNVVHGNWDVDIEGFVDGLHELCAA
jgi:hypothetical protein